MKDNALNRRLSIIEQKLDAILDIVRAIFEERHDTEFYTFEELEQADAECDARGMWSTSDTIPQLAATYKRRNPNATLA